MFFITSNSMDRFLESMPQRSKSVALGLCGKRTLAAFPLSPDAVRGKKKHDRCPSLLVYRFCSSRRMRFLLLFLPLATAACGGSEREVAVEVDGTSYRIPHKHVRSVTQEPVTFVRISPPEQTFDLVHDSRTAGRQDPQGWPIIFSLNDEAAPTIERHERGELKVVCRKAVHPVGGCGFSVTDAGARWDVLIPSDHLDQAAAIRERAKSALEAYAG